VGADPPEWCGQFSMLAIGPDIGTDIGTDIRAGWLSAAT
jgi:hypothetical protein